MLRHWLIDLIGHVSGLSDTQLRQIEKSLPASKALIDLLIRAQPIIEEVQKLYTEAEPLIDEAKNEWQTVGPAAQILIDVIGHHVNKGSSPAEAAEAVRTALNSSIKSVAHDHCIDQRMSCVTVFGVIIRPAVMFASDDGFLTTILRLLRVLPTYPIFGDGRTRLQPAYADDVAAAITTLLRQSKKPYPIYELAGPRVYSYEELLRTIARTAGLRPVLMRTPFALWDAVAGLAELLPHPPLTRNQVELMQIDTTASDNLPGFRELGISPRSLEQELEAMLKQSNTETQLPNRRRGFVAGRD